MFLHNCFIKTLLVGLVLTLAACDQREPAKKPNSKANAELEKQIADYNRLISDASRTGSDFIQQLRSTLKRTGSVLTVDGPLPYGFSVLPLSAPWVVQCGIGLSAVFGSAVTGDSNSVSNDVEIQFSTSVFTKERCREIAPSIGKEIQNIVEGH